MVAGIITAIVVVFVWALWPLLLAVILGPVLVLWAAIADALVWVPSDKQRRRDLGYELDPRKLTARQRLGYDLPPEAGDT